MHLVVPPGGSFREARRIELDARVLTIGRAEACDVRIDVPGVDDEHAKISEVALIAVGNDCAVGDVPLDAGCRRLVMPGDEIQIGSVVLGLDGTDPSTAHDKPRAPGPRIRVVEGQNFGDELVLEAENREYVIGRSPKADLRLEDREVSREHIKIVRRGFSVFLFDAASTRGSWIGRSAVYQGSRVEWQRPRMLKLGATVLSLELPVEARQRAAPVQVSAPMTPPPRARSERPAMPIPEPTPQGASPIVAYHYEAAPQPTPPPNMPSSPPIGMPAPGVAPPAGAMPPMPLPMMPGQPEVAIHPSVPPAQMPNRGSRTAWKKQGATIGRGSGILLLALAGIAILGVLFVVFSLME